jgi:predicted O-methyltransferase YrrM
MDQASNVLERLWREDAAQRAAGLPSAQRTRNVDRDTGRFLTLIARSLGARRVLEIGSSNGLSTICLARAVKLVGGEVVGMEIMPERAAEANQNLGEAGFGSVASVQSGDARDVIARLAPPFDLVFLDAEKDDYSDHFLAARPLLRPNAVVLADNVISHDCSAYQVMLAERPDVETMTLPIDRGIENTVIVG